ncbi:uncharacterized protein F4812DRAFT_410266 [Daldinia caldariorum]|uniref:uncharacterized protein n=1 Tax=Daldinia caldariorum TaxID=326644 RepID=UPI00200758EA|nr:uncharacterized protein F4812DRAFT_410266 [Daldinia caldariorum]KAI1472793.1 hypothetical protein F4812DRAFT_410266 [Daldinia caldariorum]
MAPQTRSHGNSSNPSNPSGAVTYRSTPAPPKQRLFPERERSAKLRTYSRIHTVRKNLKQKTLTQMAFVSSSTSKEEHLLKSDDEHDEEEGEEENDGEEDDAQEVQPIAPEDTVKSKKRSRGSRRKTAGDELAKKKKPRDTKRRKTMGDVPSSNPSSSFHTQTLTQFMSTKGENGNEDWQINDSQDDDAGFILETPKKTKEPPVPSKAGERQSELRSSVPSLIESVTPKNRRTKAVIPSSTSPTTPMMMRYSPAPHKSPLVVKSINLTGPSPILKKASELSKDRVIPDSYSTAHSSPTTQAPGSTIKATPKKTRFELPEDKENITPGRTKPKSPKPLRKTPAREPLQEVPDSDDDVNGTGDVEDDEASTEDENAPTERKGDETQAELLLSADEISRELEEIGSLEPSRSRSTTPTPIPKKTHVLSKTQIATMSTHSPASVIEQTPSKHTQKKQPEESPTKQHTQIYTQGIESQRLPLEAIHALGPQTENSDIMVSLHPEPLAEIINGTKNHEFRVWEIPPTVTRVWIYSTRPFSELKYMCTLGPAKVPGEIQDSKGAGNVEFNQGKTAAKYAYEIIQVYELNDPVPLEEMKKRGWVKSAPQKYIWVPPAVVGALTANLKCALFGEDEEIQAEAALVPSSPNVSESQELNAQLQDDAEFSTQHHSDQVDEVILSSQSPRRSSARRTQSARKQDFVKPAPPRLEHGSSIQSLPAPASQRTRGAVRPSQATTVSSPAPSPERLPPQAIPIPSDPPVPNLQSSSPAAFRRARDNSLRSSQFPTRSQMLPDSLINDEIQEPPPIIWDSADEQSD